MGIVEWLGLRRKEDSSSQPERSYIVSWDERAVRCQNPDGTVAEVEWCDLYFVLLRNTDQGPVEPDVFWILVGKKSGCVVPQGATGEAKLLERLQQLPGFDNDAVISSSMCMGNQEFLCWKRESES
ncbi:MAG: hypothetical protein JSV52_13655 [Candidatus Zixiibacteriota bacterium]|nr:MAG: hypothetical protein JSV52_13655 [candidate division Zixibacteria bacterium]